jgi:hypothetical protein
VRFTTASVVARCRSVSGERVGGLGGDLACTAARAIRICTSSSISSQKRSPSTPVTKP